jgi:hypothetical protein
MFWGKPHYLLWTTLLNCNLAERKGKGLVHIVCADPERSPEAKEERNYSLKDTISRRK